MAWLGMNSGVDRRSKPPAEVEAFKSPASASAAEHLGQKFGRRNAVGTKRFSP